MAKTISRYRRWAVTPLPCKENRSSDPAVSSSISPSSSPSSLLLLAAPPRPPLGEELDDISSSRQTCSTRVNRRSSHSAVLTCPFLPAPSLRCLTGTNSKMRLVRKPALCLSPLKRPNLSTKWMAPRVKACSAVVGYRPVMTLYTDYEKERCESSYQGIRVMSDTCTNCNCKEEASSTSDTRRYSATDSSSLVLPKR